MGIACCWWNICCTPPSQINIPDISDLLQLESWRMRVLRTLLRLSASPPLCYWKEAIPLKSLPICSNKDASDFSVAFFHGNINKISEPVLFFLLLMCNLLLQRDGHYPTGNKKDRHICWSLLLVMISFCIWGYTHDLLLGKETYLSGVVSE
jgi:hypothetical protein